LVRRCSEASRYRCDGQAFGAPYRARPSPALLSVRVSLRWELSSAPRPSFPPAVPCFPVPPFARRGPLGRFPRVVAPTAALRLPVAHRAWLRCLRRALPPQFNSRRRRDIPGSWTVLCVHALLFTPAESTGQAFGLARLFGTSMLPSAFQNASASAKRRISRLFARPARPLCTLRSRDCSRTTQHSLPAGGPALAGREFHPRTVT